MITFPDYISRTVKQSLLTVFLSAFSVCIANAQSSKAIGLAYGETINKFSASQLDSLEHFLFAKYIKDPKVLSELAGAYIGNQDFIYANRLLKKITEKHPKSAAPYIKYGWMYNKYFNQFENGLDSAIYFYNKAIELEPKNEKGYIGKKDVYMERKYLLYSHAEDSAGMAHVADSAIITLKALKKARPDYLVERDMADIYLKMGKPKDAHETYSQVVDSLSETQYYNYSYCAWILRKFDEAIQIANNGYTKFPDYHDFIRIKMFCYADKQDYNNAVIQYEEFCSKKDTLKSEDYRYAVASYLMLNDMKNAVLTFNRIYELPNRWEYGDKYKAINDSRRRIERYIGILKAEAEYDKAAVAWGTYIQYTTNVQPAYYLNLAKIYQEKAEDIMLSNEERKAAALSADSVYAVTLEKYPTDEPDYGYKISSIIVNRALTLWQLVDQPEKFENAYAKPLIDTILEYNKNHPNEIDNINLSYAYQYLTLYYYTIKDYSQAYFSTLEYKKLNPSSTDLDQFLVLKPYASKSGKKRR